MKPLGKVTWHLDSNLYTNLNLYVNYVPKFVLLSLARTENGDKQFWKYKFHAANEKAQHALMIGPVSFWAAKGFFLFFSLSPMSFIRFPKGSPSSQVVPPRRSQ